jgi:Flp pilus assembly protein TadB
MRQLARFYRWGNDRQSLRAFLRLLILVGLVCVAVGVGTGLSQVLVAGLVIVFFTVPVTYVRAKTIYCIRDRLKGGGEQK